MCVKRIQQIRTIVRGREKSKDWPCSGGGAARGFAHIGVLKVFEEAGIKLTIWPVPVWELLSGLSMRAGQIFACWKSCPGL